MHAVLDALVAGVGPVSVEMWHSFWDSLEVGGTPERCEKAVVLLASLLTQAPNIASVAALVRSLDARREHPPLLNAVNVVGTGGGPTTFNMSTAAALVAASVGVPIVKSGSRAYTSPLGSIDLLELLGVPLARSHEETADSLERFGIAFTGSFVYPRELTLLARSIVPVPITRLGGFLNRIGPFLAAVPASHQVTGVSDPSLLPLLEHLTSNESRRRVWLCANATGVDELVSFEDNVIHRNDGPDLRVRPETLGLTPGSLDDLRPADGADGATRQFMALLQGHGPEPAIQSICLNAASLMIAGGRASDWGEALGASRHAIEDGRPLALLERLTEHSRVRLPEVASSA